MVCVYDLLCFIVRYMGLVAWNKQINNKYITLTNATNITGLQLINQKQIHHFLPSQINLNFQLKSTLTGCLNLVQIIALLNTVLETTDTKQSFPVIT